MMLLPWQPTVSDCRPSHQFRSLNSLYATATGESHFFVALWMQAEHQRLLDLQQSVRDVRCQANV